jgi:nucleoside-diphosphate-sugar epimerase
MTDWSGKRILVTGGASFIGSHLVDRMVAAGARDVRVVDDLSSGETENIAHHLESGAVQLVQRDLLDPGAAEEVVRDVDVVFHLAALHGGRGYVELHQADCARNLALDGALIAAAQRAAVEKFVFASSGCVYPNYLQRDPSAELYLTEEMVGPPYDADGMYGWAKLMAELTLRACCRAHGMRAASCRLFTVYGERGVENHAVMAMIARAFVGQQPFEVWGDGTQLRNWTYVGDIVDGIVRCAERVDDGAAVNLGTMERTSVREAVEEVLRYTGHRATVRYRPDMPVGPLNRIASNDLARRLLGWEPRTRFRDGLHRTIDWYFANRDREQVGRYLDRMLTGRGERGPASGVLSRR